MDHAAPHPRKVRKTRPARAENSLLSRRLRLILPWGLRCHSMSLTGVCLTLFNMDSRRTGDQLAEVVGLPAACLRRAQRLRENGVIEREVALIAPSAVGRHIMLVVFVTLEGDQPDTTIAFKRRMQTASEVMACYSVTGQVDFVVVATLA